MARPLPLTQQTALQAGNSIAKSEQTPAPNVVRRRLWRMTGMAAALAALLLLPSCGGNRNVLSEPEPTPPPSQTEGPQSGTSPIDGTAPADADERGITDEETLGERLGRLDAQMRSAPPDSLASLQAEYQRLLDEASVPGNIETGGARREAAADSTPITQEPFAVIPPPRDRQGNQVRLTAYDSTLELKGLRPSELRYAAGSNEKTPAPAEPHVSKPREAKPQESKPRQQSSARKTTAASERPATVPASTNRSKREIQPGAKNFVNGVAASRAGWHAEATDELPRALSTPQSAQRRTLAEYSYAQSLESTGKLSQAAEQYLKASRSGSGLGEKSYISYCRVLAKSGQKDRARQLLVQFIGKNPKSDQVVSARQLLQTL